jgi:hypothetical protein
MPVWMQWVFLVGIFLIGTELERISQTLKDILKLLQKSK